MPTPGERKAALGARSASSKSNASIDSTSRSQRALSLPTSASIADNPNVRVLLRVRPFSPAEVQSGSSSCFDCDADGRTVHVTGAPSFGFDAVLPMDATQERVYTVAAEPIVQAVLQGYNGTIFSYGQTGTGKTYTMVGEIDDERLRGVIPRVAESLFVGIAAAAADAEFTIRCSYLEIYLERVRDLLDPSGSRENLPIHESKEHGIWVGGATAQYVASPDEMLDLLAAGNAQRAVAATRANAESSRSHAVFIVTVKRQSAGDGRATTGKLCLVDLAGSEKIRDSDVEGQQLEELKINNKSLSALGMVINALTDGRSTHVPYRDSKLTRLLQESLGGNARTALVLTATPAAAYQAETVSTLRFGQRAKKMRNSPRVNAEQSAAELRVLLAGARSDVATLKAENAALRARIEQLTGEAPPPPPAAPSLHPSEDLDDVPPLRSSLPSSYSTLSEAPSDGDAPRADDEATARALAVGRSLAADLSPVPPPVETGTPAASPGPEAPPSPEAPSPYPPETPTPAPAAPHRIVSFRGDAPRSFAGVAPRNVVRPISALDASVRLASIASIARGDCVVCACGRKLALPPGTPAAPAPAAPPSTPASASASASALSRPASLVIDPAPSPPSSLSSRRRSLSPPRSPCIARGPSPVHKPLQGGSTLPPPRFVLGGTDGDALERVGDSVLVPESPTHCRRAFLSSAARVASPSPTRAPKGDLRAVMEQERKLAALLDGFVARLDSASIRRLQATMRDAPFRSIVDRSNALLSAVMAESRDIGERMRAEARAAEPPAAAPGDRSPGPGAASAARRPRRRPRRRRPRRRCWCRSG
eukprot:tig00000451_g972.t1